MSSIINILGLSAAFAVFIVVAIQLHFDFTYNKSFEKADNIYFFSYYKTLEKTQSSWVSIPNAKDLADEFPEVNNYCIMSLPGSAESQFDVKSSDDDMKTFDIDLLETSPGFLDVFVPKILYGEASEALKAEGKLLISAKTALKLFGVENAVGKTVYGHYSKNAYVVAAVYEDFPKNSTIKNACYTYLKDNSRNNSNYYLYLDLAPNSVDGMTKKLNSEEFLGAEMVKKMEEQPDYHMELHLTPFNDIHLYMDGIRDGSITTALSLLAIGILLLIIAFINLLNISMATVPSRVRSLNMHRILGINKTLLRIGIAMEGLFFGLIATILALFFISIVNESVLANFFQADISILANVELIAIVVASLLLLSFLINLYPAIYATSFKIDASLKGSFTLSSKGGFIRNTLITIQFIVAIVLIIVSGFIKIQQDYMQNYDWGIEKENIVCLPIKGLKTSYDTFGKELIRNSSITDYTASQFLPGYVGMGWGRGFEGKQVNITSWPVSPNFLTFFGIKLIEGNDFSEENSSGLEQIIFNREFLDKYEFDSSIVGKEFECFDKGTIVGVVENINFESLREPIRPMAFVILNNENYLSYIFIKVKGQDITQSMQYIEQTWKKFHDGEFNPIFLNTRLNDLYKNENNMAKLIGVFGIITIVIAVMGVYGLVAFNTRYKRKEIAIRKVNGATVRDITLLLNKNLLTQLLIAYIIAIPIAYYIIQQWLDQFAFKASVPWSLFIGAGILITIVSVATVSWHSLRAATANPAKAVKEE